MDRDVTTTAVLADVQTVAALPPTRDPPSRADQALHGRHHPRVAADRFGSWPAALDAAGLDGDAARTRRSARVDRRTAAADLRRVADRGDTSDPPTTGEYAAHGTHAVDTLARRFGSWDAALAAADLPSADARSERRLDTDALRADLRRVAARGDTADPPTADDYRTHGDHSIATVRSRFGSWGEAVVDLGWAPSVGALRTARRVGVDPETLAAGGGDPSGAGETLGRRPPAPDSELASESEPTPTPTPSLDADASAGAGGGAGGEAGTDPEAGTDAGTDPDRP